MKTVLLFFSLLLVLAGCGLGDANEVAIRRSKEFHKQMKQQNTDGMLAFIHEDALASDPEEEWRALFEKVHTIGKIKSIKKDMSFNSEVNNGVHTVTLNYTIVGENTTLKEKIIWRTSKDGKLKILGIDFSSK